MKFLYCHGFASGPQSRKARAFQNVLVARGIELIIPSLDGGDFEHLTISSQLGVIEKTLGGRPAILIGSSMGGYLAALYAASHPEIDRLVLLAPAFSFAARWKERLPPAGDFEVFHYGTQTYRRVARDLIEDALQYPAAPDFRQPAVIFHGVGDDIVPIEGSRDFVRYHPNATLTELDSDHELLNELDRIATDSAAFLAA